MDILEFLFARDIFSVTPYLPGIHLHIPKMAATKTYHSFLRKVFPSSEGNLPGKDFPGRGKEHDWPVQGKAKGLES